MSLEVHAQVVFVSGNAITTRRTQNALQVEMHLDCYVRFLHGGFSSHEVRQVLSLQSLGKIGDLVALSAWRCSMQLHWKWKGYAKARTHSPLVGVMLCEVHQIMIIIDAGLGTGVFFPLMGRSPDSIGTVWAGKYRDGKFILR